MEEDNKFACLNFFFAKKAYITLHTKRKEYSESFLTSLRNYT